MSRANNHNPEMGNHDSETLSDASSINTRALNLLNVGKSIQLSSGEKISINEIKELREDARDSVIQKYGFSEDEGRTFKENVSLNPCNIMLPLRGCATNCVVRCKDGKLRARCKIDMNPSIISDKTFYMGILFHELDHFAFFQKHFLRSRLAGNDFSSEEEYDSARNEYNRKISSDAWEFSTELIARIDTADELMSRGISWDKVRNYGPGNERETTGKELYTQSIIYAKKFLKFQIGLYNLLARQYGFDKTKGRNQQLTPEANIKFQGLMELIRNSIFNSESVETSKQIIDVCIERLRRSNSREDLHSSLISR